jgi:glycosyltransferase involved in cell wall biosynthesis
LNPLATRLIASPPPPESKVAPLTVSIVICTRNRADYLRDCLEAVSQLDPGADEVLVVDNTAGDIEAESLAKVFGARYIVEESPGLSRARNRGLYETDSEIIAFLDDDAIPNSNWLGLLLEEFANPDLAIATGETVPPDFAADSNLDTATRYLSNKDPLWFEIATFGGLGFGTNMALRRDACSGWKGFDERLGRGTPLRIAEESHAFASLLSRGYRAAHVPAAIVVHPLKPIDVQQEASSSIAYWLLLFSDFPGHRLDLVRFLIKRVLRRPIPWPRSPQEAGEIINSGWRVYLKAVFNGALLFLRNRRSRNQ